MLKFRRVKRPIRKPRRNPDTATILLLGGGLVGGFFLVRYLMDRKAAQLTAQLTARGQQAGAGFANIVGTGRKQLTDKQRYEFRPGGKCFDKATNAMTNIERCDAAHVLEGMGGIFSGGRGLGSL